MSSDTLSKQAYYTGRPRDRVVKRYWEFFAEAGRVLDLGCGTGEFGRHRPGGVEVHGLDRDPGALEIAARWETVTEADLEGGGLPYPDGFFDGVLVKDVLEHLRDPAPIVWEIHRVLRPGGVVIASVVQARPRRVWADYTHVRGFTRTSAALLFQDAAFGVEGVWPMGGVPLSNRLGFMGLVPMMLRIPVFGVLWASSWELCARKPRGDGTQP